MTVTTNHTWYTNFGNGTSTGYYAVAKWAVSTAYTAGQLIRQNTAPAAGSERVFVCIVAGTSASAEPTWVITKGAKTSETGGVTWMECTGQAAVNGDAVNAPLSSANRSGAQVLGATIQNTTGTYYFICTTAGTTGASDPSFVFTAGSTTTDGTCTWTCLGTVGSFAAWGAPIARLMTLGTWPVAGDTVYISSAHVETYSAGAITINYPNVAATPSSYICVGNSGYNPPLSSDVTTGASFTGSNSVTFNGSFIMTGLALAPGAGNLMAFSSSLSSYQRYQNCTFTSSGQIQCCTNGGTFTVEWYNCTIAALSPGAIMVAGNTVTWRGGAWTGTMTGNASGMFDVFGSGAVGRLVVEGVDLGSTATVLLAASTNPSSVILSGCRIPSTAVVQQNSTPRGGNFDLINCDSGGAAYRHERWWNEGSQVCDITAVRTSGASDGVTAIAWKLVTAATAPSWTSAFECMPITIWNAVTGADVNVTLQAAYNGTALPFNDQIWMDCRYYGTAGSTALSTISGTKANVLTTHTAYSASSAAWDSIATTRSNSNAYGVGNLFRLSSNPGQLFICITAGTSATSQPGAYASVADGVSVTDGTAVCRALVRFAMTVTLTGPQPQIAGYIRCYVRAALPSSTFWVDPLLTLS